MTIRELIKDLEQKNSKLSYENESLKKEIKELKSLLAYNENELKSLKYMLEIKDDSDEQVIPEVKPVRHRKRKEEVLTEE